MTSKLGKEVVPRIKMAATWLLAMWCPVYRWRDSNPGLGTELGNSSCDAKRKPYKWEPRRGKLSMHMKGGGSSRTSVEVLVMRMERRGCLSSEKVIANQETGMSICFPRRFVIAR